MNTQIATSYQTQAADVAARNEAVASPVKRYLAGTFPNTGRVQDVGCGSGRDLPRMLALGHDSYGAEHSSTLRECALLFKRNCLVQLKKDRYPR